ncbi:redox-sensing transcriptional repressor Rex [Pyramidobacter piscolens]|uniref:redox-sensing transcriptional repressor Rex n=1 Tax=Pyramidobacter piscolens TaxID=638849 RepID=UPI001FCAE487|nr:redox-sensing transcriptional repressor Rex [Pyramidobacter piscolens]BDF77759.1 redox-sensing transcriptional repressor Rex [Pyramidobacter piscolens]
MGFPIPSKKERITDPTVGRLVAYRRLLMRLVDDGVPVVSSKEIGEMLRLKSSQVRKDLSYLGEFGKRGVGYDVSRLLEDLAGILAPFEVWRIGLVGIGRLGEALLNHRSFLSENYEVTAVFDSNPDKVGRSYAGKLCYHIDDLPRVIVEKDISVLILTVPQQAAQAVLDAAAGTGKIEGVLNFSAAVLQAPPGVQVKDVDIFIELEKLLFKLKASEQKKKQSF